MQIILNANVEARPLIYSLVLTHLQAGIVHIITPLMANFANKVFIKLGVISDLSPAFLIIF